MTKPRSDKYSYLLSIDDMAKSAENQHMVDRLRAEQDKWIKEGSEFSFDPSKTIEDEVFNLKVRSGGKLWDLAGPGAIGVIAGPAKARKTAILSAIEAAALSGKEVLGFGMNINIDNKGSSINNGRILSIDTEQKESSFYKVKKRVWSIQQSDENFNIYDAFWLRTLYPEQRIKFIEAHFADPSKEKPRLLIIDVITDLMHDINDYVEGQRITEWLMKFAGKSTTVIVTIHLSKQGMVNGHIGSALSKKVDFMIEIRQDEEDQNMSVVKFPLTRDCPKPADFTIRQDHHPSRIYRPDLELIGGWKDDEQEFKSFDLGHNIETKKDDASYIFNSFKTPSSDDDIPF